MYAKNNASGYDLYLQFYKFPLKGLLMYVGNNASKWDLQV